MTLSCTIPFEYGTKTISNPAPHSSTLPTLPLEIVEMICDELDTRDLASLVGTCLNVYQLTINRFAQRYTELYLDFTVPSFNHLNAIASNKVMREHVQRLVVMTPEPHLGQGIQWQRSAAGHIRNPLSVPVIQRFRNDLVNNLVNCRSFIISPIGGERSLEQGDSDEEKTFNPDDVVGILWDIIADASLPIKAFWYGKGMNYTSDVMDIQRFPKRLFSNSGFRAGWGGLYNLHLEHRLTPYNYSFLLDLILHAPNIRKLHLSLSPKDLAAEFFSDLSRSENLPCNLEKVTLSFTSIQADNLIRLLYPSRGSLRRLVLNEMSGMSAGCLVFLEKMQSQFPKLEAIEVNTLYGGGGVILDTTIQDDLFGEKVT